MQERGPVRYQGSCHCGAVRFAISPSIAELTTCDCSMCRRRGVQMATVPEGGFELLSGSGNLAEYNFHTGVARHFFCKTSGIYPFHRKRLMPDCYGINTACLDGFDPSGIPVRETHGSNLN